MKQISLKSWCSAFNDWKTTIEMVKSVWTSNLMCGERSRDAQVSFEVLYRKSMIQNQIHR